MKQGKFLLDQTVPWFNNSQRHFKSPSPPPTSCAAQSSLSSVERYDPRTNTWTMVAPMNMRRSLLNVAVLDGGWDGTVHLNSGEVYEPEIDQWSFIAPASTARWDAGIAVESDKIYIVGGCDRNAPCTLETECYDPEKNKWSKVASLPVQLMESSVVPFSFLSWKPGVLITVHHMQLHGGRS